MPTNWVEIIPLVLAGSACAPLLCGSRRLRLRLAIRAERGAFSASVELRVEPRAGAARSSGKPHGRG